MGIVLNRKTVAQLTLPEGRTEQFFWDEELKGFGVRFRIAHDGKLMRSWVVTYRHGGKQHRPKLADLAKLNVDQARKQATEMLAKVVLGIDPIGERGAAPKITLRSAIETYIAGKEREVMEGTYQPSSLRSTKLYLLGAPYFGPLHKLGINEVTRAHVAQRLAAIRDETSDVTAGRARAQLAAFFTRSMQEGICESNPTIGTRPQAEKPERDRVLRDGELRAVWNACGEDDFGKIVKLLILTACRRSEIGSMCWSWLDLEQGTVTIPGTHTKNRREHVLALTPVARSIIDSVPKMVGRDHLFGLRAEGFTSWPHCRIDAGIKPWRLHDLRRTCATGMANLGVRPDVVELVLNHTGHRGGVGGVYNKSSYRNEVRIALVQWSDHVRSVVDGIDKKVVNFAAFQQA
jgi:integrase